MVVFIRTLVLIEGAHRLILEAMACDIPPVLSPMPCIFDHVVEDGVNGRIPAGRDPATLAEVLASEEKRLAMGRAARETITQRFAARQIASKHLDLYRRLIGERAS